MKSNRRKFLQQLMLGTGAIATSLPSFAKIKTGEDDKGLFLPGQNSDHFNMCGYAAPPINLVRIGIIGLGMRGSEAVERLSYIDGVEIIAPVSYTHLRAH